jgi:hypothetical protein
MVNEKNRFKILLCSCATMMLLFSCDKKNNNEQYSCNAEINEWASRNNAKLGNYNRRQLANVLGIDSQKAIYRTFTPEQKCNVWKEKLQLSIDSSNLTVAEKNHLLIAHNYLQPSYYQDSVTLAPLESWMNTWGSNAMKTFGWDSVKLFLIAETLLMPAELNRLSDYIRTANGSKPQYMGGGGGGTKDCDCRSAVGCQWFVESCDKSSGCNPKFDCGLFGTSRCLGGCSGGIMATTYIPPY